MVEEEILEKILSRWWVVIVEFLQVFIVLWSVLDVWGVKTTNKSF